MSELVAERLAIPRYRDRRVSVFTHLTRRECRITIRDEGRGFRPADLRDPTDPENLSRVSGRGILLMRAFLDEVTYGETGNEVLLVVKRGKDLPNPLADLHVRTRGLRRRLNGYLMGFAAGFYVSACCSDRRMCVCSTSRLLGVDQTES